LFFTQPGRYCTSLPSQLYVAFSHHPSLVSLRIQMLLCRQILACSLSVRRQKMRRNKPLESPVTRLGHPAWVLLKLLASHWGLRQQTRTLAWKGTAPLPKKAKRAVAAERVGGRAIPRRRRSGRRRQARSEASAARPELAALYTYTARTCRPRRQEKFYGSTRAWQLTWFFDWSLRISRRRGELWPCGA
jgi:hypothetical protein